MEVIQHMNTSNPTTIQFQSAYKKLLLNNMNVLVSASANCSPQDKTLLISDNTEVNSLEYNNNNKINQEKTNDEISINKLKRKRKISTKPKHIATLFILIYCYTKKLIY